MTALSDSALLPGFEQRRIEVESGIHINAVIGGSGTAIPRPMRSGTASRRCWYSGVRMA